MTSTMTLLGILMTLTGARGPAKTPAIEVSTADTALRIVAEGDKLHIVSMQSAQDGHNWVAGFGEATSIPLVSSVNVDDHTAAVRWQFQSQAAEPGRQESIFRFTCDRPALELKSIWRAYTGPGPVEHTIQIMNRGSQSIRLPLQPTLAFSTRGPVGHALEHWWVERGGSRPSEFGTHHERIGVGFASSLVSTPYGGPIPWSCVQDTEGERGWYAGIEFSGFVRMTLRADQGQAGESASMQTVLGLGKSDAEDKSYRTRLAAGETFQTPTVFLGCYRGDVDDGANRLRRWVETRLRPPSRANLPLLTNNTWGDGMAVDEAMVRRMIDLCAALGLEMIHLDAGWYRQVGNWRTHPGKFPKGLAAVADYSHNKGLLFGLWIAWTQGGHEPDPTGHTAVLSVRDPAMNAWFPHDYPNAWKNSDFTGATVCLAEPKAVEWCLRDTRRAVQEYHVDLLEHDQELIVCQCERRTHGHTSSPLDVAYHAARGYYEVQDGLRASFPNLLFENCCNGGNLVDYGVLTAPTMSASRTPTTRSPIGARLLRLVLRLAPFDVRVLHREPAGKDAVQLPPHASQRNDGLVYDHDGHEPLVTPATGRRQTAVRAL